MHTQKRDNLKVDGIVTSKPYNRFKNGHKNNNNERFRFDKGQNDRNQLLLPFLVRAYWKHGEIVLEEFEEESTKSSEILLYLFMGSTLRDIVDHLKYQLDNVYRRDLQFKINNIYFDQYGIFKKKELGVIHSVKTKKEDDMKLKDFGFKIGDMLIIEISGKSSGPNQNAQATLSSQQQQQQQQQSLN